MQILHVTCTGLDDPVNRRCPCNAPERLYPCMFEYLCMSDLSQFRINRVQNQSLYETFHTLQQELMRNRDPCLSVIAVGPASLEVAQLCGQLSVPVPIGIWLPKDSAKMLVCMDWLKPGKHVAVPGPCSDSYFNPASEQRMPWAQNIHSFVMATRQCG